MDGWKKLLLKCAGFGAGFALVAGAILGGAMWWSARPAKTKSFDRKAISATWSSLEVRTQGEVFHLTVKYSLKNNTDRDYRLPSVGSLMIVSSENAALEKADGTTWDSDTIIPPGQVVNEHFDIPYQLGSYNLTGAEVLSDSKEIEFAQKRMKEIGGFAFFDYGSRYEVDLPKWPVTPKS